MFSNKDKGDVASSVSFEAAKEATRRATFLATAGRLADGGVAKPGLEEVFRVCRSVAIAAGAAAGQSAAQVDAAISAVCDADMMRLKTASDEEIRRFSRESGEIVKAFLAKIDVKS